MNKYLNGDFISYLAKRAIDIVFIHNQLGTAMGILLGFVLEAVVKVFKPSLDSNIVDFSGLWKIHYIAFGIFLFNIPTFIKSFRHKLNPGIEDGFRIIREAKKDGKLSDAMVRQMYKNYCEKVLETVTFELNPAKREKLKREKPNA